jgi:hypothetical protein
MDGSEWQEIYRATTLNYMLLNQVCKGDFKTALAPHPRFSSRKSNFREFPHATHATGMRSGFKSGLLLLLLLLFRARAGGVVADYISERVERNPRTNDQTSRLLLQSCWQQAIGGGRGLTEETGCMVR